MFAKKFILALFSSAFFRLHNRPRFVLICFAWEIKGFYQSSFRIEVDFRDIMNASPNILAKN